MRLDVRRQRGVCRRPVGHIELQHARAFAARFRRELVREPFGALAPLTAMQHRQETIRRRAAGNGFADALRGAGHEKGLAGIAVHFVVR